MRVARRSQSQVSSGGWHITMVTRHTLKVCPAIAIGRRHGHPVSAGLQPAPSLSSIYSSNFTRTDAGEPPAAATDWIKIAQR